jgi:hypothetical protein
MDILTAIFTRRSVRRFTPEPIAESDLETLLRAGMQAPSADNGQPWYFVVINDREIMDSIPKIHPWSEMMREAALGILVCGRIAEGEMGEYWQQDCAAATEKYIADSPWDWFRRVWLGICPEKNEWRNFSALVGLPGDVQLSALIALGIPRTPTRLRTDLTLPGFTTITGSSLLRLGKCVQRGSAAWSALARWLSAFFSISVSSAIVLFYAAHQKYRVVAKAVIPAKFGK